MFIYDGFDFSEYLLVRNVGRPLLPPIYVISRKIPGQNKEQFIRKEFQPITIPVEVVLYSNGDMSYNELKRFLADKLHKSEPKKLQFLDDPERYYLAILRDSTEINDLVEAGETTLHFYCPDPIAYGKEINIDISSSPMLYNSGTWETAPLITAQITQAMSSWSVILTNTGEYIQIDDALKAGDEIFIDCEKEYATKNGESIMPKLNLGSTFFKIPTGEFRLVVSGGTVTLKYHERWL